MPTTEASPVRVAVGIIRRDDHILIAKRPEHLHKGGLWEFPGGKLQGGESLEYALARELEEELGIQVDPKDAQYLFTILWEYPEKKVQLEICLVDRFTGDPKGREGQPVRWVDGGELDNHQFPEANADIICWVQQFS